MILHKGETLFHQGDTGPLFHISSGLFKVVRIYPDGGSFLFNILVPHHSLITPKEYHGTAIALVKSEAEAIPSSEWYEGLARSPETYRETALLLQGKLRMMQQRIDQLTSVEPMDKLLRLIEWFRDYISGDSITDILTQEEIGQLIGVRRETVNRLLLRSRS